MKENIFDNSNIAESYAGVTTPLTFSFVRYVYQEVYQYFSKMMGVENEIVEKNKHTFEHMVEFLGYRIYYNLNSWYKMLSFFPGYRFSGEFMEKMMGVEKHKLIKKDFNYSFHKKYLFYFPKVILQSIKISVIFLLLRWNVPRFNKYFDKVFFEIDSVDLDKLDPGELKKAYWDVADRLLSRWRVPIANDFAVMVSAGLADRFFKNWLNSNDAYSYMHIVNKDLISLDPGNKIVEITNYIKEDKKINELFANHTEVEIMKLLHEKYLNHHITQKVVTYLKEFGSRMPNELKLESETLTENPNNFIALIKGMIQGGPSHVKSSRPQFKRSDYKNLSLSKGIFLGWLLRWAGSSINRREETRFRRAFIFGHVRKIFLAVGDKFVEKKVIKDARDIFYLSMEETFHIIDNETIDFNPLLIIEERKLQFSKWQNIEFPRRFETTKSIHEIERELLNSVGISHQSTSNRLAGRVASRPDGVKTFSGEALTLKVFDPTANFAGKILVTYQTDPGWTVIFPLLTGIVVERGGMLSHAAIVARELNIPCIVGVEEATNIISNGTKITLDLQNGLIQKA